MGEVRWGAAADGERLYAAAASLGRPAKAGLDPKTFGSISAVALDSGQTLWSVSPIACHEGLCGSARPAAITAIPGAVFSGSVDGRLRAYSTEDGKILWENDTTIEYKTVNGIPAKGGSIDSAGPAVVGGMLFVNSGYARMGGAPGNALLAFSVDGK